MKQNVSESHSNNDMTVWFIGILLRLIRVVIRFQLLHSDFQPAFFSEGHVLLLQVCAPAVRHFVRPEVDLVADECAAAHHDEEDD